MGSERPPAEQPGERRPEDGGEVQRYGPLLLERITKKDGRALIIYSRADRPPQPPQ
jgi:hypothetical protein